MISGVKSSESDVVAFKGIPFAAPPVGDLRWKAPQPVVPWQGVKACNAFGPSPMQSKPAPFMVYTSEFLIPAEPISEDCLYLNVWTKALAYLFLQALLAVGNKVTEVVGGPFAHHIGYHAIEHPFGGFEHPGAGLQVEAEIGER